MAFTKPIGSKSSFPVHKLPTTEEKQKSAEWFDKAVHLLEPHMRRFVQMTHEEAMVDNDEREAVSKMFKGISEFCESEEGRREKAEAEASLKGHDTIFSEAETVEFSVLKEHAQNELERLESMTEEEWEKENRAICEERMKEDYLVVAGEIARRIINTGWSLFKDKHPQSLTIPEFLEELDLGRSGLRELIPEKYYPEIKEVLRPLLPLLLKESYMMLGSRGKRDMELCYLDSLSKIVVRPVRNAVVQIWANS